MTAKSRITPSACAAYGGGISALLLAACCAGLLAVFGVTSALVTLGARHFDLLSDAVLYPLLAVSILVTIVGVILSRKHST